MNASWLLSAPGGDSTAARYENRAKGGSAGARVLRTTSLDRGLRLSHMSSRHGDLLVVHTAASAPERIEGADLGAHAVPVVVFAESAEERERLWAELPLHVACALRASQTEERGIRIQELFLDEEAYRVTVADAAVSLTLLEFKLLVALVRHRERVLSRATLLRDVWQVNLTNESRTVDTHVKRLRDKLGCAGRFIESVRGVGYRFSETPREGAGTVPIRPRREAREI